MYDSTKKYIVIWKVNHPILQAPSPMMKRSWKGTWARLNVSSAPIGTHDQRLFKTN
jgi:hypothetical protein